MAPFTFAVRLGFQELADICLHTGFCGPQGQPQRCQCFPLPITGIDLNVAFPHPQNFTTNCTNKKDKIRTLLVAWSYTLTLLQPFLSPPYREVVKNISRIRAKQAESQIVDSALARRKDPPDSWAEVFLHKGEERLQGKMGREVNWRKKSSWALSDIFRR